MAPNKRAASQTKAAPKTKVAKVEEVDPFVAECAPVRALIGEDATISAECREMLEAMAPHCLKTSQAERHEFQERMAGALHEIAESVQAGCLSAAESAETQVANADAEKEAVDAAMAKAEALVAEASSEKAVNAKALKESEEAAESARKAVEENLQKEVALEHEHKENVNQKAEIQTIIAEKWAPVKDGAAFTGQQWRERNKAIDAALQPLEKLGLDESLMHALPVALKMKPEARGKFAQIALGAGETAFAKQVAALSEKIAGVDAERQQRTQAVADAEATMKTAEEQQEAAAAELLTAKEKLSNEEMAWGESMNAVKEQEKKAKQIVKELTVRKEHLASVRELAAKFVSLRERQAAAAAPEVADAEMELEPAPPAVEAM